MRGIIAPAVLSVVVLCCGASAAEIDEPTAQTHDEPLDLNIEERSRRRLAQIDVAVDGPLDIIGNLKPEDFQIFAGNLVLGGQAFTPSFADRFCPAAEGSTAATAGVPGSASVDQQKIRYVFFFDQPHLTIAGRERALELARELVRTLITDGNRTTLVSTGRQLATYARDSDDPEELLRALDRLEGDREQVDLFGENMEGRMRQILYWRRYNQVTRYGGKSKNTAYMPRFEQNLAYQFQKEEIVQASRSLRRLSMVIRSQADHEPPKVLFYFADTMISRPGQIYIQLANIFVDLIDQAKRKHTEAGPVDPWAAVEPFDAVLYDANASGVRLYPIQAEGLVQRRFRVSAKHSLGSMAKETGGRHFINGVAPGVIADDLRKDLSCIYLLSFDPSGLPEDQRHGVMVQATNPHVRLSAGSKFLLRSDEGKREADLVAALTAPDTAGSRRSLSGALVPLDFQDGNYTALLQLRVPASHSPGAVWDMGFSIVWRDAVRESAGRRLTVARGSTSLVLEQLVSLPLSDFELMMVAQEENSDSTLTSHVTDRWPDPRHAPLSVGSIDAIQPDDSYFVRGEETRSGGMLSLAHGEPIRCGKEVTFLTLVCRNPRRQAATLKVASRLTGALALKLPPEDLDLAAGRRCELVRRRIPAWHLFPGTLTYTIAVTDPQGETSEASRRFSVSDRTGTEDLVAYE